MSDTENLLLAFIEDKPLVSRALKIVSRIADLGSVDESGVALQVGNALYAPATKEAFARLKRIWIYFDSKQKRNIRRLVRLGRVGEAQEIILTELEREYE